MVTALTTVSSRDPPDSRGGVGIKCPGRKESYIGVTPSEFWGLHPGRQVDVTLPITHAERGLLTNAEAQWFSAVARLRPGATLQQATAQANAAFQRFTSDRARSGNLPFDRLELAPASRGLDQLRIRFGSPLYAMTLVAALLLLIACANLGVLLLVRGAARGREFAVRLATGAGRGRLVRQVVTETLLLFLLGAAAALLIAYVAIERLTGFFSVGRRPILLDVQYDWTWVAYAAVVTLTTGLLTGLWPALRALRTEPHTALKGNEPHLAWTGRLTKGRLLVAGQVALSLALLVTAALFAGTMVNLRAVDLGFRGTGVLTMSLQPDLPGDTVARDQLWMRILERVRGMPGVRSASLSVLTPLSGRNTGTVVTLPDMHPRAGTDQSIRLNHVSDEYFRTFGIELIAGRSFTPRDATGALKVTVLNETAAKAYFAGRSPIGETVAFRDAGAYQVIGVVRDHKHLSVREDAPPFAFVPLRQPIGATSRLTLAVASDRPHSTIARVVADEVRAIHPSTLVSDVIGVEEQIDETLVSERLLSMLASGFAALVMGLAAVGLYGLVSYSVAGRRTEFGVRIALGAQPSRVASSVLGEVLVPVAAGIAVGLPVAFVIARSAETLLFGVTPAAPGSYVIGAAALVIVACAAAWVPARRACSIEPAEALRPG